MVAGTSLISLVAGDECLTEGTVCEVAELIRVKALAKIAEALCCIEPFTPIQVNDEKIDFLGYIKALQGIVQWTYDVCKNDAGGEPEVVITSAFELCRVVEIPSCGCIDGLRTH